MTKIKHQSHLNINLMISIQCMPGRMAISSNSFSEVISPKYAVELYGKLSHYIYNECPPFVMHDYPSTTTNSEIYAIIDINGIDDYLYSINFIEDEISIHIESCILPIFALIFCLNMRSVQFKDLYGHYRL